MASAHHRIFRSTPIPRYVQLAERIRQRLAKGQVADCAGAISA